MVVRGTALRRLEADLGELLARHEKARTLGEFACWAEDPVGFIKEVLGETDPGPWAAQVKIAEAVRDDPLVLVRSCNSAGKDWIAARLGLWWVYARRGLVLLTGPTERQVIEVCMGEVARAFRCVDDLPGELYRTALRLEGAENAGILAFTSTAASRLTGFHAPRVMAILTEAQGVEEFAWEGLLACATGSEDRVLAVGNPLTPSGRFYSASQPGSGWEAIQISAEDHPNLVEGRTVIPGGPSLAFVKRIAQEFGNDSGIYRARVEGEFPDQGEEGLFRRSWIEAAMDRWNDPVCQLRWTDEPPVVAVDPARYGPDVTCAAICRGQHVEEIVTWGQTDLMETTGRLVTMLQRSGVLPSRRAASDERLHQLAIEHAARLGLPWSAVSSVAARGVVVVDEVGLGSGLLDRLVELGYAADGFNGGRSAETFANRSRFLNLRAEAYWRLRELLEAGEVAVPPDEALRKELLALRWRPTSDGRVQLESKDELRGRLGRSPDRADAVCMAVFAADSKRGRPYDARAWPSVRK